MPRVCIRITYDGTHFFGWQKQAGGERTVQGVIEKTLKQITGEDIRAIASGRTDRGVHALSQTIHFDTKADPEKFSLKRRLRKLLPLDIGVRTVHIVPNDFHAQISAEAKTYIYRISQKPSFDPFLHRWALHYPYPLELGFLNSSSNVLLGEHDFASFQTKGTEVSSTIRQITEIRWHQGKNGLLLLKIKGSGFLKHMVRNIVGTQLDLARKNLKADEMTGILEAQNRQAAAAPAPPQGLCLLRVKYPSSLDNKCRKL